MSFYKEKDVRKKVKEAVKSYKHSMMGKYTIVDYSGSKWKIEYNILYWRKDWNTWDHYNSCSSQIDIYKTLAKYIEEGKYEKLDFAVSVCLMCGDDINKEKIITLDGKEWRKK